MTSRTYRALLVANSTFPADAANLPELEGPRNDPVLLRDALCDGDAGMFPPDNVRLVTERTMSEVLGEVEDFLRSATRQDTVLLYYSGHGLLDQNNELFLCTRDTRSDRLWSSAINANHLRAIMDESAAAATVVVLDCCHSGRFKGPGVAPGALAGRGRFVLTSSRSGQLAHDAHVHNHASLFTHHLAEGLRHGADDPDGDGLVTLTDIYAYVHAALVREGRQVPQKHFAGDGDVALALRTPVPAERTVAPDLVDPASAAPVLDLSDTSIDLEVDADEVLPPERVAVINRGGGSLEWTVESSAPWVEAEADEAAVVLHLRPESGRNRANVYVRDTHTGTIKTLRVSVRVRPPSPAADRALQPGSRPEAPEPIVPDQPVQAAERVEPVAAVGPPDTELAPRTDAGTAAASTADALRWIAAAGVVVGFLVATSAQQVVNRSAWPLWFRGEEWGAGLQLSAVAGAALALAAAAVVARPQWRWAVGLCLGLSVPLGIVRFAENFAFSHDAAGVDWFPYTWVLALVIGALLIFELQRTGTWRRGRWAPDLLVGWALILAAAWAALLVVDSYHQDLDTGSDYGGVFSNGGSGWGRVTGPHGNPFSAGAFRLVAATSVVTLLYCGFRRLPRAVGRGVVVGAVAWPLLGVAHEIQYLVASDDHPDGARRLMFTFAPALLLTILVGRVVVARPANGTPHEDAAAADEPGSRSLVRSVGYMVGGTSRGIRRRPIRVVLGLAVVAALVAGGTLLLPTGPSGDQRHIVDISASYLGQDAFMADNGLVAIGTHDGVEVVDASAGDVSMEIAGGNWVDALAVSSHGELVTAGREAGVQIWEGSHPADEVPDELPGYRAPGDTGKFASDIELSPDGDVLALLVHPAAADTVRTTIDLWDPGSREQLGTLPEFASGVAAVAFSPNGETLAVATSQLELWDVATREQLDTIGDEVFETSGIDTVAFSPDERYLATSSSASYGGVELFDLSSGDDTGRFLGYVDGANAVAFSPDGELVAGGIGHDIGVWEVATGTQVATLEGHDRSVDGLAFSPDGQQLASAGEDDTVRIWSVDFS